MDVSRKFFAELIGTFWLVFAGCGSALLAAGFTSPAPDSLHLGIGFVGVSLAFGLTVVSMAYGIGHISGAHLNPAVTLEPSWAVACMSKMSFLTLWHSSPAV